MNDIQKYNISLYKDRNSARHLLSININLPTTEENIGYGGDVKFVVNIIYQYGQIVLPFYNTEDILKVLTDRLTVEHDGIQYNEL